MERCQTLQVVLRLGFDGAGMEGGWQPWRRAEQRMIPCQTRICFQPGDTAGVPGSIFCSPGAAGCGDQGGHHPHLPIPGRGGFSADEGSHLVPPA